MSDPLNEGVASAATEEALGELHKAVAVTLTDVIANGIPVHNKDGEEVDRAPASAAHIGAAIAFLKNNNITASPTRNKDLAALKQTLANQRKKKALPPAALEEATAVFEAMQGQNGMMQ